MLDKFYSMIAPEQLDRALEKSEEEWDHLADLYATAMVSAETFEEREMYSFWHSMCVMNASLVWKIERDGVN